jgi:hypothetical protein
VCNYQKHSGIGHTRRIFKSNVAGDGCEEDGLYVITNVRFCKCCLRFRGFTAPSVFPGMGGYLPRFRHPKQIDRAGPLLLVPSRRVGSMASLVGRD